MTKKAKTEFEHLVSDILENKYFLETKHDLHHGTSKYEHSIRVAKLSYKLSKILKADEKVTARAGLLHDFFFGTRKEKPENSYLKHPVTAAKNAQEYFGVSQKEAEAIKTHMFHHVLLKKLFPFLPYKEKVSINEFKPKSKEGWIICASDLIVSIMECERFQFSYVANVTLLLIFNMLIFKH